MEIPIYTHGRLMPDPPWEGPVVSVFPRAFNILHPDGLLVGVVASAGQMSPFSLVAEGLFAEEGRTEAVARISKGALCRRAEDSLTVAGIRLDLSVSRSWDGRLPPRLAGSISAPGALAGRLRSALAVAGADDGLREVVVPGASQTIFGRRAREILGSSRGIGNGAQGIRELSHLIGLGIGFTPSGDDFVSGVLLAREMAAGEGPELDLDEVRSKLHRTNDGGRTLLTAALFGSFPAYLLQFADAIGESLRSASAGVEPPERLVESAVRAAAAHGETSGTDAVTGFTWYLALLGGDQRAHGDFVG